MEKFEAGSNTEAIVCGIGIGLMASGAGFVAGAALFAVGCLAAAS